MKHFDAIFLIDQGCSLVCFCLPSNFSAISNPESGTLQCIEALVENPECSDVKEKYEAIHKALQLNTDSLIPACRPDKVKQCHDNLLTVIQIFLAVNLE